MVAGKYIHDRAAIGDNKSLEVPGSAKLVPRQAGVPVLPGTGQGVGCGHLFLLTGSKRKWFAQKPERDGGAFMLRSETRHAPRSIL
jgi:hypothetical protein